MKTIVSVTPLPVSADSRTFKIAASFTRFGYRSIVVEGVKSDLDLGRIPFSIRSLENSFSNKGKALAIPSNGKPKNEIDLKQRVKRCIKHLPDPIRNTFSGFLFPSLYFSANLVRIKKSLPVASLYYLHAPYQFPAVYWLSRGLETPIIYDAHDFYPDVIPSLLGRLLESWCIEKAAAIVTVSEGIARLIYHRFNRQAVVVRNCQDVRLEQGPGQGLRETLGLPSDIFLLVTVGQAKPGQAVAEALEALSGLPNKIHLAFLGKNTNKHRDLVKRFRLQSRVHLVPPVKQDEVVRYIRSADAALILYYPLSPQYENCLPNGFFQSISAELPLIYPELPEIKKLAETYRIGLHVNPQSANSIREAVRKLTEGRDIVSKFKKNLRAASLDLSWEHEESILYDLVKGVLGKTSVN
jgi:glycosyltransferase involved in cell wall biosynthesis